MAKHNVRVWDKPYEVTTYQESKSVWYAVAEYKDKEFRIKGRTESAAVRAWCKAARYSDN